MTQPTRLDPRIAWHIDARHLMMLVPHADPSDLHTLRGEFARAIQALRVPVTTWQEAWNVWTGATSTRPGQVTFTRPRCPVCHGRRFTHRNAARNITRTGSPYGCAECNVTGRGGRTTETARYATAPATHTPETTTGTP
jgi:hypothetical protein